MREPRIQTCSTAGRAKCRDRYQELNSEFWRTCRTCSEMDPASLTAGAVLPSISHTAVGAGYSCIATGSVSTSVACTVLCEKSRREVTPRKSGRPTFCGTVLKLRCASTEQVSAIRTDLSHHLPALHLCVLMLQFCRLCMLETGWARDQHANHGELF